MKLEIRAPRSTLAPEIRAHLERRVRFAVDRFAPEIHAVVARLEDLNGPRGGVDQRCRMTVRGPRLGELVFERVDQDLVPAIDRATSTMGRAVARALRRARRGS